MTDKQRLDEQTMALRVAREFEDGMSVNLGVGIPSLAANFIPSGKEVLFHTENGAMGFGSIAALEEADIDLTNASGQPVSAKQGMSVFDASESFAFIRGGHVDVSVMGGLEVSEKGDLANWIQPGRQLGSIGGAMDLGAGVKRLIVVMTHTTKDGKSKIRRQCALPLTVRGKVSLIVTDIAVIEVTGEGLVLKEVAPGWTTEDVQSLTEPRLIVSPDLIEIQLS